MSGHPLRGLQGAGIAALIVPVTVLLCLFRRRRVAASRAARSIGFLTRPAPIAWDFLDAVVIRSKMS